MGERDRRKFVFRLMRFVGIQKSIEVITTDPVLSPKTVGRKLALVDPALDGTWGQLEEVGQFFRGIKTPRCQSRHMVPPVAMKPLYDMERHYSAIGKPCNTIPSDLE